MAEIEEFAMTNAMDMIEDDQLMMGLSAYTKINKAIGSDKTMSILTTLLNVVSNNLMPFANQVMAKMEIMKAAGKGINAINNNAFMMVNQFMTKKRCRTIFTRIVKKIDKDDFDKAYPYIKSFLKFDLIEDLL
uniref:DUF1641 domain-containing protein n=1 Tax=Parastrongyloides trichosuri TaxID=131310 RepID=A0A0N4ZW75_PARTI